MMLYPITATLFMSKNMKQKIVIELCCDDIHSNKFTLGIKFNPSLKVKDIKAGKGDYLQEVATYIASQVADSLKQDQLEVLSN